MLLKTVLIMHLFYLSAARSKVPKPYNQTKITFHVSNILTLSTFAFIFSPSAKHDNPNYIRDRYKYEIRKPEVPYIWWERYRKPFNSAWMDYCDPYNCNDYHKTACGLNRDTMRFKFFQSQCHIILSNMCASWRGNLKYDIVEVKFCHVYTMQVRSSCPRYCESVAAPVCAISYNGSAVLFLNECALEAANCRTIIPEFEQVSIDICDYYLRQGIQERIK